MLSRYDGFDEDSEVPASYLKAKSASASSKEQIKNDQQQVEADLDDEVKPLVDDHSIAAKAEEVVEEEDLDSPASSYPGMVPTPKGVFPVRCLVETMCGEDDGPEQWFPADIIEVKPFEGKEKVPIGKLESDDGNLYFLFFKFMKK